MKIFKKLFKNKMENFKPVPFYINDEYSYLWWISKLNGNTVFYAAGFGGQILYKSRTKNDICDYFV